MALDTLGGLRTAVLGPRTDLVTQFADMLTLAEQRIYYGADGVSPLRVLPMESNATLAFTNGVASLPTLFLDKRALYWEGVYAVSLSYEPPSVFYPSNFNRQGETYPSAYTLEANSIKLSSNATGNGKLLFYSRAGTLSADNDTNVILAKWPGVYMFGCQIELYRITRNYNEQAKAMKMYGDAVMAANNQAMMARSFGGPLKRRVAGFGV